MSSLDALCAEFNKKSKETIVQTGIQGYEKCPLIPLSSPRANYSIYGGIPLGRLVEFFGDEGSGKTTTALDVCANYQKNYDKKVLFLDAENTYDTVWATKLGVDSSKLIFIKPMSQTAEELFQFILDAIETDEVGLVIIDSLAVLLSQQAYEKDMSERTYGGISMALTTFSKKAEMSCHKHMCTVIGINQMRDNLASMYGGVTTTGGRAWKHNCSLRIQFKRGDFFDDKGTKVSTTFENPSGHFIQMSIVKSKCFPNDRKTGFYRLHYYNGIMQIEDTIEVAMKYGYIVQGGAWYSLMDLEDKSVLVEKFQGMGKLIDYMKEHSELYENLKNLVCA